MRIAIGSDHRGVAARQRIIGLLQGMGHDVIDCGSHGIEAVDYPDIAADVAGRVSAGTVDRGILLCCTGVGMAIAANKLPGVRAATCHDEVTAEMSRRHNDLNVLCLSAELIGPELQDKMLRTWLDTPFEGGRDFLLEVLDVRVQGAELALRASQSALLHQGARGYLMSAAPQRRIREAHFVAIVTPAIKHLRWEMARLMREEIPS